VHACACVLGSRCGREGLPPFLAHLLLVFLAKAVAKPAADDSDDDSSDEPVPKAKAKALASC
jgi:hypothetical protein